MLENYGVENKTKNVGVRYVGWTQFVPVGFSETHHLYSILNDHTSQLRLVFVPCLFHYPRLE